MFNLIFFWVSVAVIVRTATSQSDGPVVKTSLGSVQGRYIKSYEGRTVAAFEGIPFAKPPVGELRFKEPQPAEPWSSTLKAEKTYTCVQYTATLPISAVVGDEDCLYLYVYVPRQKINSNESLDVVVHIHGGAFAIGDPKSVAGPDYIMDRDLVYVSMNYRLGILGFLSTQDQVVPGNNGLKDQVLAMKWVKENIKSFGGNPDSITLVGASSGGASVHYHYLSPLSRGLFNRGFSQSGTALNPWALTKNPVQNAKKLGEKFDCKLKTSKELVDCLRKQPVKDLVLAQGDFYVLANTIPFTQFAPVIEFGPKAFLPDHPYKLILEGRVHDYPWITSNTKDEGIAPVGFLLMDKTLQELGNRWVELAPAALDFNNTAFEFDKKTISTLVRTHYLRDEPLNNKTVYNLIRLFSDRLYHIDAIKAVCLQATVTRSPVYYYFFDYKIEMPVAYKGNLSISGHGDDVKMLYRQADSPAELSPSDRKMKNIFIDFLYRYASTGKPDFKGVEWKPVYKTEEPLSYIHISSPEKIRRERSLNLDPFIFWHNLPLRENEHLFPYVLNAVQFLPVFY